MTLKEAYEKLGGDYADTTCRIGEDMLLRLIGILLKDSNYTDISTSLKQQDYEASSLPTIRKSTAPFYPIFWRRTTRFWRRLTGRKH